MRPRLVREQTRSIGSAAVLAALWSVGIGLLLCSAVAVVGWALGGQGASGFGAALRAGGLAFVVAHHVPLSGDGVTYSLLPLGLLAVPALLTYRAGRWAARSTDSGTVRDLLALAGATAALYGAGVAVVASASGLGAVSANPALSFVLGGAVAFVGVVVGAAGAPRCARAVRARVPEPVRDGAYAALATLAALAAGSGVLLTVALLLRLPAVAETGGQVAPGAGGGAALLLLGLLYLPNALVWAGAYATGAGFVLGGAVVSPVAATGAGAAPAFPLLVASPAAPPAAALLVLAIPVAAGVVGGLVLLRRARGLRVLLLDVLVTTGVSAVLAAVLVLVAGGALGDGRLEHLGPTSWLVGLAVGAEVLAGATVAVALGSGLGRWRSRRPVVAVRARVPGTLARLRGRLYDDGRD